MKAGTIVRLSDGRIGTVVYHGLDGYGIKLGEHDSLAIEGALEGTNPLFGSIPENFFYFPEIMLRKPYKGTKLECVPDYEIIHAA